LAYGKGRSGWVESGLPRPIRQSHDFWSERGAWGGDRNFPSHEKKKYFDEHFYNWRGTDSNPHFLRRKSDPKNSFLRGLKIRRGGQSKGNHASAQKELDIRINQLKMGDQHPKDE